MQTEDLRIADGAYEGDWIKSGLGNEISTVADQVPQVYEAYARIFHPAGHPGRRGIRWAEVAKATGRTAHREMQWESLIAGSPEWEGQAPMIGSMDADELDALCEILAAHTTSPDRCYFGLCTIECWEDSFSADELKPLLELPMDRDHIVLAGPLSAVDQILRKGKHRDLPNLIWPADRSWFVVSEVDFDSTLVGGSAEMIKAIVGSLEFEAWQVKPTDSLAFEADKINGGAGAR